MTIRHCVLVKFRADVPPVEREGIYAELAALRDHLAIEAMSFGHNVSPEGLHQGFLDGFTIDFPDAAARDAYLVDDAHKQAGARLVAALEGGSQGLLVFDIEV
ncbi:MAG: Dabb [Devosia sp.]|uniref:Dabb family protein n=1 Tax=Devosia sp. TaxID=1871048 RepID=UPI002626B7FD|nr:Dabb family protein [Devosia sp.]MDB5540683.1 Dabb [Devosia sp.]